MTNQLQVKSSEEELSNYLWKTSKMIANTDVVPDALKGKPDAIFAIILAGRTLGLEPTTAIQSFNSIKGKLTMSAELMRSLILAAGHDIDFIELTNEKVTLKGTRKTGGTCTVTWTMDDAKRAELGGVNWKKYPRAMLIARATTELARFLFADVIKGISYTPEELGNDSFEEDLDDSEVTVPIELDEVDQQRFDKAMVDEHEEAPAMYEESELF